VFIIIIVIIIIINLGPGVDGVVSA